MVDVVYTKITVYAIKFTYLPNCIINAVADHDKNEAKLTVNFKKCSEVVRLGLIRLTNTQLMPPISSSQMRNANRKLFFIVRRQYVVENMHIAHATFLTFFVKNYSSQ